MLSVANRKFLENLAPVVLGTGACPDFLTRAESVIALSDDAVQKELRLAMAILQSRLTGLLFTRRFETFLDAPADRRKRRLERFRDSSLGPLRTIYVAVQRLCGSVHYSHRETFASVGYGGAPEVRP